MGEPLRASYLEGCDSSLDCGSECLADGGEAASRSLMLLCPLLFRLDSDSRCGPVCAVIWVRVWCGAIC